MANADRPRGFAPYGTVRQTVKFQAGSTIAPGEFVALASDGQVDAAGAGATILGLALNYATANQDVMVIVDPDQLYVGQADETEIDAQTDVGNLCDIVATADNTTYKAARMEIDSSTIGTGSGGQLVILGIEARPDNAFGAQVDVICKINEHQLVTGFAGV